MKQWSRMQIMKGLQKMVPEIDHLKTSEEFGLKKGGIWTIGEESGWLFKEFIPFKIEFAFDTTLLSDYGYTDPKYKGVQTKAMYPHGIHREIYSWLEERGWYPKWYDGGTLFFWKDMHQIAVDIIEKIVFDSNGKTKGLVL
ncbi:MAG: hypothetical protein OPY06_00650 [Nitrosopumilus sp.]|nr:hypothetical protein [Nitrosopumilus sp.]MDF2425093.1 hypothetical protein [Nitrosopumilus sp.]MDF2429529.1 hypothetical protein [Nitrosopumilus sp.]